MRMDKNWLGRLCGVVADLLGQDIRSSYPVDQESPGYMDDPANPARFEDETVATAYSALRELEKLWCSEENKDQMAFTFPKSRK